jgi:acyl carrier protein
MMSSLKELQALIQEKYDLDPSKLDPDAPILDNGVDSLALVEFLFEVEDKFGIAIPDSNAHIETLTELATLVDRLRAEKAG